MLEYTNKQTVDEKTMKNRIKFDYTITLVIIVFAFLLFTTLQLIAQEKNKKDSLNNRPRHNKSKSGKSIKSPNAPQVIGDTVSIKNNSGVVLMTVTDEGSAGSIKLNAVGIDESDIVETVNKLYNINSILYWNGSALSSGSGGTTQINDLSDAKYDGESLFIGDGAGANDDAGTSDGVKNYNTAVGKNALKSNTTGYHNTANGRSALYSNTTGSYNTANGRSALFFNTTGSNNTANGVSALRYNTTGMRNTANGIFALYANTTGSYNTGIGDSALYSNTTGDYNTAIGHSTLKSNTDGGGNTAVGSSALKSNTMGDYNTAVGSSALHSNIGGNQNTAFGYRSLSNNTNHYNTAIGYNALSSNTSGHSNTANGASALEDNIEGYANTATGNSALRYNTYGNFNTANGHFALFHNTNGNSNVGIGYEANSNNQGGSNNTIIGYLAGSGTAIHDKSGNVFIGYQAGYSEHGSNLLYIENSNSSSPLIWGDFTDGSERVKINGDFKVKGSAMLGTSASVTGDNSFAIGSDVSVTSNGTIFISDNSASTVHTSSTDNRFAARFANGYRFFTTSDLSVGAKMNGGDNSWSVISDSTKKENFKLIDGEEILNKVSQFILTSWNYKTQDPTKHRHYGPMAQSFYSAFGNDGIGTVGNDTTIASADFDGINFISIQALEKRTKLQKVSIKHLSKKIKMLDERVKILEDKNKNLRNQLAKNATIEKKVMLLEQALNKLVKSQPQIKFSKK